MGNVDDGVNFDGEFVVDSIEDFVKINFKEIKSEEIMRIHFLNMSFAFMFYNRFGSVQGFYARKSKFLQNSNGEMIQQTFFVIKKGIE